MYENVLILAMYLLFRLFVHSFVAPVIANQYNIHKKNDNGMMLKFKGTIWRLLIYTFLLIFGLCTLWSEEWVFHPLQYRYKWPTTKIPYKIDLYYRIELLHYILSLVFIFKEPKMKDFKQMVVHHVITLYLITTSYKIGLLRYGTLIMLLHDFSDPFMEIGKTFFYLKCQNLADNFFTVFAAIFLINRCFLYPTFLVYPIYITKYDDENRLIMCCIKVCLVLLSVINLIWSFMIVKMAIRFYKDGCVKDGDIRVDKSAKSNKQK
ncbi:Ceramide synthase 2 [Binucleata daphniae]